MSQNMNTILVVGGTSGIGEAFARRFHRMGKKVIITGRREARLAEIQKDHPGMETYCMDLTNLEAIPTHAKAMLDKHADIDTVWLNSGIINNFSIQDITSTSDAAVINELTTNLTGPILLARHLIPHLVAQKSSETTFMMTSSRLGFLPNGNLFPVYCPTKAAIHAFVVGVRQSLKETNVNVIEIVPPLVATNMETQLSGTLGRLKALPLDEFTNQCFHLLDNHPAKDLKEVGAGGAVVACDEWRASMGKLLESSGIGG